MFRITDGKGFQITLPNGYTVSVQFGRHNYCDNRDVRPETDEARLNTECANAETGVWHEASGEWVSPHPQNSGDDVCGHQNSGDVLELLNIVAAYPPRV